MTPDKEIELCENVATITANLEHLLRKMDSFTDVLEDHTQSDATNFQKIEADLEVLKFDKAKAIGGAEEAAKHASSSGRTWGAVAGGIISLIVTAISAYFSKP